ncbi:hypothetical protein ACJX0J_025466 [Zea mays]
MSVTIWFLCSSIVASFMSIQEQIVGRVALETKRLVQPEMDLWHDVSLPLFDALENRESAEEICIYQKIVVADIVYLEKKILAEVVFSKLILIKKSNISYLILHYFKFG